MKFLTVEPVAFLCQQMMKDGWADNHRKRPSFKQICQQLGAEITDVNGGDVMDRTVHLLDQSLRSLSNLSGQQE